MRYYLDDGVQLPNSNYYKNIWMISTLIIPQPRRFNYVRHNATHKNHDDVRHKLVVILSCTCISGTYNWQTLRLSFQSGWIILIVWTAILTLSVNEGLVEVAAEQRIRQVPEVLLEKSCNIVGTLIGTDLRLTPVVPVLPQLDVTR